VSNCFEVKVQPGQLDLAACLNSGQVFRWKSLQPNVWSGVDGGYWYVVKEVPGKALHVNTNAEESQFRSLFRLDQDEASAHESLLKAGPEMEPLLRRRPGLKVLRQINPEETLFCFLCTANNHIARITSMIEKLAAFGKPFPDRPEMRRFPQAEVIAGIGETRLRELGFGYRAKSITQTARELLNKPEGWLKGLKDSGYHHAHAELVKLPGVGPKLADCVALFGLDIQTSVPIDVHIWRALTRLYHPEWVGQPLTQARYKEAGDRFRDRFGELAGWAQQQLFLDQITKASV